MSAYNNLTDYDRPAASMKAQPELANAVLGGQLGELSGRTAERVAKAWLTRLDNRLGQAIHPSL